MTRSAGITGNFRIALVVAPLVLLMGCQREPETPPPVAPITTAPPEENGGVSTAPEASQSVATSPEEMPAAKDSATEADETKIGTPDPIPENRLLVAPGSGEEETEAILDRYVGPDEIVRQVMSPPPDGRMLSEKNHVWIDLQRKQVIADGYVAMRQGVLEMFACPSGTKEHESVVATLALSSEVHAALLAVGAQPGTTARFLPNFVPATGQVIRVWVCWRDQQGNFHAVDARHWIHKVGTEEPMEAEWVFAGSGFWKDPASGREYYQADAGDMICVSNFSTAMLDVSIASSAEADQLMFQPAADSIPERGTPIRLVLVPIPNPIDSSGDDDQAAKQREQEIEAKKTQAPSEQILPPLKPAASSNAAVEPQAENTPASE